MEFGQTSPCGKKSGTTQPNEPACHDAHSPFLAPPCAASSTAPWGPSVILWDRWGMEKKKKTRRAIEVQSANTFYQKIMRRSWWACSAPCLACTTLPVFVASLTCSSVKTGSVPLCGEKFASGSTWNRDQNLHHATYLARPCPEPLSPPSVGRRCCGEGGLHCEATSMLCVWFVHHQSTAIC